ncbi:hypothetical protein ACG9XS_01740 [Acinetobacter gyllenbergii]|uniref:hypothetical protein n=1 Tax=Acinetobacter gyllenbergii TaxID=134534 RepID=UPI003AF62BF2
MLTILVEIMMSVFIANFKASEHPIINVVVRGVVIGVTVLCIIFFSDFIEGKKSSFLLGFMISFIGGFLISLLVFFVEIFCKLIWGRDK